MKIPQFLPQFLRAAGAPAKARLLQHLPALRPWAGMFVAYLFLAVLFFGIDVNFLRVGIAPGDGFIHGVPSRMYAAEWSLWIPYLASGMSRLATQGFQALYWPALLVSCLFPSAFGYNLNLFLHYACAGFFTALFLTRLGHRRGPAFLGGVCFMFCGFLTAHKGHHTMMNAAVWLPLVLYFAEGFFANPKRWGWLVAAAAAYAMVFYADYLAIPVYTGMVVAPYLIFRSVQTSSWLRGIRRALFANATVFGLGLLLAAPYILPIVESLPLVTRERIDYSFFASYSFQLLALPLLLLPQVFGTQSDLGLYRAGYFGPYNLTELAGYAGLLPVALALVAFLVERYRTRQVWFWAAVASCGFVLALGSSTPIYPILFHVPIYNMFRAPARNWYEVHFAISVLAAYGAGLLLEQTTHLDRLRQVARRVWVGLGGATVLVAAAMCGLGAMAPHFTAKNPNYDTWQDGTRKALSAVMAAGAETWRIDRANIFVPLLVVIVGAATTWVVLGWRTRTSLRVGLLVTIAAADLATFGHFHDCPYIATPSLRHPESNLIYQALDKNEIHHFGYRVLPLDIYDMEGLFPNTNLVYRVPTVTAYEGIVYKNYQGLTGLMPHGLLAGVESMIAKNDLLSLLGTRYLVTKDAKLKGLIERGTLGESPVYSRILEDVEGHVLYRNNRALPILRFVDRIECVSDEAAAIRTIRAGAPFDPRTTALVDCGKVDQAPKAMGAVESIDERSPDRLIATVRTGETGFLVYSDCNYPGWIATIDGKPAPVVTANAVHKGLLIRGAGTHRVEFAFKPRSLRYGLLLLLAGLLAGGALVAIGRKRARAPYCAE